MQEVEINELIKLCHDLDQRDLVCSTGGNVSIRSGKFIYITPTGVSLREIRIDNLVKLNLEGEVVSDGKPSIEYKMHLELYQLNNQNQVVVHVHSPYIIAASCMSKPNTLMPVFTPSYASRVGFLKILPFYFPGTEELSIAVAEEAKKSEAVILMNHGVVVWGSKVERVQNILEEIEENAKIFIFTQGKGKSLSGKEIEIIRKQAY